MQTPMYTHIQRHTHAHTHSKGIQEHMQEHIAPLACLCRRMTFSFRLQLSKMSQRSYAVFSAYVFRQCSAEGLVVTVGEKNIIGANTFLKKCKAISSWQGISGDSLHSTSVTISIPPVVRDFFKSSKALQKKK